MAKYVLMADNSVTGTEIEIGDFDSEEKMEERFVNIKHCFEVNNTFDIVSESPRELTVQSTFDALKITYYVVELEN